MAVAELAPFQPKGSKPEWRLVYDRLRELEVGEIITYQQLDEALDRDFRSVRSPIYKAQARLEQNDHRTIAVVENVGYRIITAMEHERLAKLHQKKGRRQVRRARAKLESADRAQLPPEVIERFDRQAERLADLEEAHRRLERRVKALEETTLRARPIPPEHEERLRRIEATLFGEGS